MNIALVGAGRIGTVHAGNLAADARVDEIRITDIHQANAESLAASLGGVGATVGAVADPAALIDRADALVIASSTDSHAELIVLGAEKRIPIFCEKPISLDLLETERALKAVAESGIRLQMGFQRRFDRGFAEIQRLVQSGSLGRVYTARLATHDPSPPSAAYLSSSGGLFSDMLIHDFDLLRWTTGQEVVQVYATGGRLTGDPVSESVCDIDTAAVIATLEEGAVAVITGARHHALGHDVRLEVLGSNDSVVSGIGDRSPLRFVPDGDSEIGGWPEIQPKHADFQTRFEDAYRAELREFISVISSGTAGTQVAANGENAREALRIATAAQLSWAERRPVDLSEIT